VDLVWRFLVTTEAVKKKEIFGTEHKTLKSVNLYLSGKITFVVCVKPLFFMISSRIALSRGC
jgi:hypothetical protein